MSEAVFITGASGNVGREVITQLSKRGVSMVAATRQADKAAALPGVTPRPFDFTNSATWDACLEDMLTNNIRVVELMAM